MAATIYFKKDERSDAFVMNMPPKPPKISTSGELHFSKEIAEVILHSIRTFLQKLERISLKKVSL
jgi:hypothetical protein